MSHLPIVVNPNCSQVCGHPDGGLSPPRGGRKGNVVAHFAMMFAPVQRCVHNMRRFVAWALHTNEVVATQCRGDPCGRPFAAWGCVLCNVCAM